MVSDEPMIRMRRVAPGLLRRRRYEIEIPQADRTLPPLLKITSSPAGTLTHITGPGDAWVLVHAADEAWNGRDGRWVSLLDE